MHWNQKKSRIYFRTLIISSIVLGIVAYGALMLIPQKSSLNINEITSTSPISSHLKYFGYYNWDYPGATPTKNFKEIINMGNTNVAFSDLWGTDTPGLAAFQNTNILAIVPVDKVFFGTGTTGKPNRLLPDWQARLQQFKTKVAPYQNNIYGYYLSDEPIWNDISKADFILSSRAIREAFPSKATLAVEAYPPIEAQSIPDGYFQYVTDIGFDYYFTMYHPDNDSGWAKFMDLYNKFKPYTQNKKVWLIPDGYAVTQPASLLLPDALDRYYNFAKATNEVVGILVYSYGTGYQYETQHYITPNTGWGLYKQSIRDRHIAIGKSIITGDYSSAAVTPSSPTPTPTPTGLVTSTPTTGNIESFNATGMVTGWLADPDIGDKSTNVHFYLDGPAVAPYDKFIGQIKANSPRPDVFNAKGFGRNSGFNFQIPISKINDGKSHTIYVYGIDLNSKLIPTGNNTLLGTRSINQ